MYLFEGRPKLKNIFLGSMFFTLVVFFLRALSAILLIFYEYRLVGWRILVHPHFLYADYCQIGLDIIVILVMIKKKSFRIVLPLLFYWLTIRYLMSPKYYTLYPKVGFFLGRFSHSMDLILLACTFWLGLVIGYAMFSLWGIFFYQKLFTDQLPRLKKVSFWTTPTSVKGQNHLADQGSVRGFLFFLISLLLFFSAFSQVNQFLPRYFSYEGRWFYYGSTYRYVNAVILPVFFHLLAIYLIYKKWKPLSYFLPYLIIHLAYRGFIFDLFPVFQFPKDSTQAYIAGVIGKPIDQALIILILLNTLLLPLDWVKWIQKKRRAVSSTA